MEQWTFLAGIYALNAWAVDRWYVPLFVLLIAVSMGWSVMKANDDGLRT